MSYKSNVRIRLTKTDYNELVKELEETRAKEDNKNLMNDLFNKKTLSVYKEELFDTKIYNEDTNTEEEKSIETIYFGWNNLKWYSGYKDVDFVMNFIQAKEFYAYTRMGEETDDIVMESENFDDIEIGVYFIDD